MILRSLYRKSELERRQRGSHLATSVQPLVTSERERGEIW